MPIPNEVLELIERFDNNLDSYRSGKYNETQVRREFIDPFFKCLGWDIDNKEGYAEAYKDVVHEDAIKVGDKTKAPDYCFRIGGTRKFFLEAKKPSVNIKNDEHPAFQLRRYGWSAKLPLSILTDFEELAVYDCRFKPEQGDKSSVARTKYYTYKEYVEKWDEIESIFSRNAILKGSFDKYAESNKAKRGTAEVDDAFLAEIESWRDVLAKNIALRNQDLSQRELNVAVQKTIDRIIFLRICEDRGIEPYGALRDLNMGTDVYRRLGKLFQAADDRYNSGLFYFNNEKGRIETPDNFTLDLSIDDKPLKDIVNSIYYPQSAYEFSVVPADILGQVYEQFLGKVIRLTASNRAVVEEKPEVKKAGGVYYTPKYVVDYIVEQTVGKLLEGKTLNVISGVGKTPAIRCCDPACGSGSFLIVVYDYFLKWYLDWYVANEPEKLIRSRKPKIVQVGDGEYRLTTDERKRILLTHIYGVDIDNQAVEVTKLSLLLKVLEGENQESLKQQTQLFQERVLPDLSSNIKCGNSLISSDYYANTQDSIFDFEERHRVNAFDWENEFKDIFDDGGFNAIVGNPPYGATLNLDDKKYLNNKYPNQSYQLDSYLIFLEKSVSILMKESAMFGMIIPNPWLTNIKQDSLRNFLLEHVSIQSISHFLYKVFPKVTVDTQVVIFQQGETKNNKINIQIIEAEPNDTNWIKKSKVLVNEQKRWKALDGEPINIFLNKSEISLALKCKSKGEPLGSFYKINVGIKPYQTGKGKPKQTKEMVKLRVFDSSEQVEASYKKYLRGKDISKYKIEPLEDRFIKYGEWLAEPRPAANFSAPVKIFMRQTGDSLIAAIDTEQYYCLNNMHVLVPEEIKENPSYILALINSKLMNWYYQTLNPEVGEALAEVKKTNVAKLPIKRIDFSEPSEINSLNKLVELANSMSKTYSNLRVAKTTQDKNILERQIDTTNNQIDQLVYELYDLTREEIEIIEDS